MKNHNKQNGLLNKVKNKETAREQKTNSNEISKDTSVSLENSIPSVDSPIKNNSSKSSSQNKKKKRNNLDKIKKYNSQNNKTKSSDQERELSHKKASPLKKVKEKEGVIYDEKKYDLVDINDESVKKKTNKKNKVSVIDKVLDKKKTQAEIEIDKRIEEQKNKKLNDFVDNENDIEVDDLLETRKQLRKERKQNYLNKIGVISLLIACFYVVFLIYGLINTPYVYNKEGKVVPEKYTVEDVKRLDEFNTVFHQYKKIRDIYEQILNLNYRYDAQTEDVMIIAADYESEIETIITTVNQTQALHVSDKYNQIISQLDGWLVSYQDNNTLNDSAKAFCSNMSLGISQNNQALLEDCASYTRNVLYSEFLQVTQNLTAIGKTIKGADIQTLYEWSPEKYVSEQIGAQDNNVGSVK